MDMTDRIDRYLRGWTTGDAALLLEHAAADFFFDDPHRGRIARADYAAYVAEIKAEAEGFRAGRKFQNFENLSDIVVKQGDDGTATVWFWWEIAGTPIEGSSLVKIGKSGVLSETICYYGRTAYAKRAK
jgi:hypothetical protein